MRAFVVFFCATWALLGIHSYLWIGDGMPYTVPQPHCGDLARIGAVFSIGECRQETVIDGGKGFVPLAQAKAADDMQFTTVFGGDSFARGRASGPNNYFEEMYAQRTGERTTYLIDWGDDQRSSYAPVATSGLLNTLGARHFVLVMSERNAIRSFGEDRPLGDPPDEQQLLDLLINRDQAGYMDPRHIAAVQIIEKAQTDFSTRIAATATYLYFAVFWEEWEYLAGRFYRMPWRPKGWGTVVAFPDLITSRFPEIDRYAASVVQRNGVGFDIRTSLNLRLRNVCNDIAMATVGYYICDGGDLYQAKLNEAGRELFGRKRLPDFLPNYKASLDLRGERGDRTIGNISEFACLIESTGVDFTLVIIPARVHVYEDFIEPEDRTDNGFFENLPSGVECGTVIDTYAIGRAAANAGESGLYFYDDTHWAPPYHDLIMAEIERQRSEAGSARDASSSHAPDR